MKTSRSATKVWLVALLALPLGATGVWWWSLRDEAEELQAGIAALRTEQPRLNAELAELDRRRAAAQTALAEARAAKAEAAVPAEVRQQQAVRAVLTTLKENAAPLAGPTTGAAKPATPMAPSGPHGNVYFPELYADARYARAVMTWQRQRNEERFAPLFASLPLSAAELARFKELIAQKEMAYEEVDGVMENQAMREKKAVDRSGVMQVKMRVNRTFDDEIKQAFGEAVFAQYQGFLNGTGARQNFLDDLTLRLSYSGAPLEREQANQLTALYSSSRSSAMMGGGSPLDLSDGFVAEARAILKPQQMAGLLQIQTEKRAGRSGGSSVSIRTIPVAIPPVKPPAAPSGP